MRTALKLAGGLAALVLVAGCEPIADPADDVAVQAPVEQVPATPAGAPNQEVPPPAPAQPREPASDLLRASSGGDGDSWRDTTGREFRLGMVNTPEVGDCFSREATAERTRLVAAGFRADVYTTDRYGREVSVVTASDGTNLNVHLARHGFADDRYLAQFRHGNPALADQLDAAFAAAKAERAGLWGACQGSTEVQGLVAPPPAAPPPAAPPPAAPPPAAPAAGAGCHPDYATCIPVQGDGSGRGDANDLDCGSIGQAVQLRQAGVDPYRLDRDGDGVGCDR